MTKGQERAQNKNQSKMLSLLMIFCACIFSASMFAGLQKCGMDNGVLFNIILTIIVLILCATACFKKLIFLSKVNLLLIPLILCILTVFFVQILPNSNFSTIPSLSIWSFFSGGFFCLLYIVLNLSLSSVVIASSGEGLIKKQIRWVSLISSLILSVFIFVINFLILCNYDLVSAEMPLLSLASGVMVYLLQFVIIIGCLTTLLSMVYISSEYSRKLFSNKIMIFVICVILPFSLSLFGFSSIVSYLYPLASFLGIFILFRIFFKQN